MLAQQADAFGVALLEDPLDLGVDDLRGRLAVRLGAAEAAEWLAGEKRVFAGRKRDRPELFAHTPASDHLAGQISGLLHVVFGARRAAAVDPLFGPATTHRAGDPGAEIVLAVVVAVVLGPLVSNAERLTTRHDRHAIHRVGEGR